MYNPTLEALAIGMQAGETRTATLPEGEVTLTVQAVQKRVVPALTDEMAAACKLPGVRTVAGYRRYLLAQQRDKAAAQAAWTLAARIKRAVLDESVFVLCKADWKQAVERELDRCRAIARQSGMVLEQMTPEQFAGNIPVKSYAELVAMTQDTCFDSLRCCLLGRHYAQNDGFAVTEAGYRGIPPPKTPRSLQPHGTGRCIMDQARRCCSSQTIRVGFSALMRRARTVNTRMVSSVKTTSHTAR